MQLKAFILLCCFGLGGCISSPETVLQATGYAANDAQQSALENLPKLNLDEDKMSDAMTIQRYIVEDSSTAMAWTNELTGSHGDVLSVKDTTSQSRNCREFTSTLHSYNGISLYKGQSCQTLSGGWRLEQFEKSS